MEAEALRSGSRGTDRLDGAAMPEDDLSLPVAQGGGTGPDDAARVRTEASGKREPPGADLQYRALQRGAMGSGAQLDPFGTLVRACRVGKYLGDAQVVHRASVTGGRKARIMRT